MASAISAPPTKDGVLGALAEPEDQVGQRQPEDQNATAAGSRAVTASRMARMVSAATPARSPAAASREADGSIAVASETVINECGRIHTAYALA